MCPSYWMLLCVSYEDPSEVLNLIDAVRIESQTLSPEDLQVAEKQCTSAELELHLRYTPLELARLSCHRVYA